MSDLRVLPTPDRLAEAAGDYALDSMAGAIRARGRALLALAGGSTPRGTYTRMAEHPPPGFPWERVHVFWSDERVVPHDSENSNYRLARETLLAKAPIPHANVHPIPTSGSAEADALAYERELRTALGSDGFDVAFLGVGPDGHTASLFPGSPGLNVQDRWMVGVPRSPRPPHCARVSATLPLLNRAARVLFLVEGAEKRSILARVLEASPSESEDLPAARVTGRVETIWFVDRAAAGPAGPRVR